MRWDSRWPVGQSVEKTFGFWVRQPPIASLQSESGPRHTAGVDGQGGLGTPSGRSTWMVTIGPISSSAPRSTASRVVLWFDDMGTAAEGIALNAPGARSAGMAMTSDATRLIIGAPGGPAAPGQVIMLSLPL